MLTLQLLDKASVDRMIGRKGTVHRVLQRLTLIRMEFAKFQKGILDSMPQPANDL